jgi:hypothetical protein
MWRWFGREAHPSPDPEKLLVELSAAALGAKYTDMDRYREFKAVLLSSDQGRRVLHQILTWGHVWTSSFDENPGKTAFAEGERNLALRILAALHFEPTEKPTQQNVKRDNAS